MQYMMPLMMGFIFLNFASGLALYILIMNIFRMAVQYFVIGGWGNLSGLIPAPFWKQRLGEWVTPIRKWTPSDEGENEIQSVGGDAKIAAVAEEGIKNEKSRSKRKNRRRGH